MQCHFRYWSGIDKAKLESDKFATLRWRGLVSMSANGHWHCDPFLRQLDLIWNVVCTTVVYARPIAMNNYMIVKQRVKNFAQFQTAFDELKPIREQHGLLDVGQFRSADEENTVIVVMEATDVARAREYWQSDVLAKGRKKAGAIGPLLADVDQVWLTDGLVRDAVGRTNE